MSKRHEAEWQGSSFGGRDRTQMKTVIIASFCVVLTSCGSKAAPPSALSAATSASTVSSASSATPVPVAAQPAPLAVRVRGDVLFGAAGQPIRLRGANRDGTEWACVNGDTPSVFADSADDASVAAMAKWHIQVVRIPLNEDCWLGINGVSAAVSGEPYRSAIVGYVGRLHAHGVIAILELHLVAPGKRQSTVSAKMADADHAPTFWSSVASRFHNDAAVIFDLYNEPHLDDAAPKIGDPWACWRDGCTIPDDSSDPDDVTGAVAWAHVAYHTAGMQQLIDAIRATGAHQPVMLGGLAYANDDRGWARYAPHDPDGQLVVSFHTYANNDCVSPACWDSTIGALAESTPVIVGEVGESDCKRDFVAQFLPWADGHAISYLAWSFDRVKSAHCANGDTGMIVDSAGTPGGAYGSLYYDHLTAAGG